MLALAVSAGVSCASSLRALATASSPDLVPRSQGWLVRSYDEVKVPAPPAVAKDEMAALSAIVAKRTAADVARFRWWSVGGPAYRWNEMILDEMQEGFVTLPLAARHLALFHAALDDAVAAARHQGRPVLRSEPLALDTAFKTQSRDWSPSEHAAAAGAAAEVLAYLFPPRAAHFAARAEQAIQARLLAGVELPHESTRGRAIGQRIAALAVARGKADMSDAKWADSVPQGPGFWRGANPIAPSAGTWATWVLAQPGEFRPAAPPAFDSEAVKSAINELKTFPRTPKTNHRGNYWEVHGGARAHTLWNEIARAKLLESNAGAAAGARILATLNIALADVGIACWDAKYTFWYIRPPQLDADLKPLFPPPNHPSYPAAHGCFSTAAAVVLAHVFPQDRDRLLAMGKEAAEARTWAGIHYRFDIDAGQELGRKVAERALERAFTTRQASPIR